MVVLLTGLTLDWLAVGLDPEKSCFVIESQIPENAELTLWLSWFLPLGMLQRNPTLKAEMDDFGKKSVAVAFCAAYLLTRRAVVPAETESPPAPSAELLSQPQP